MILRRITEETLNWPTDQNGPSEPALAALVALVTEFEQTFQAGRERVAAYGAAIRGLEQELAHLSTQYRDLEAQADRAPDPVILRRIHADQSRLQERMTRLQQEIEQGRKTTETLHENLHTLQDRLQRARVKLQDVRARDLIEGDSP